MLDELHARVRSALLDAGVDPMANHAGVRAVIDECLVASGLDDDSDGESVTVRLSAPVTVPFLGPILGGRAEVVARARLDYRASP